MIAQIGQSARCCVDSGVAVCRDDLWWSGCDCGRYQIVTRWGCVLVGGVFLNYRGADSGSYAPLLYKELCEHLSPDEVFLDSESIAAGADFAYTVLRRVRTCNVLLAIIGPNWLIAPDREERRLIDNPADWIRRELVEAFQAGVTVIPVLIDGAEMPREVDLPGDIAQLGRCQYRRLRYRESSTDLARIRDDVLTIYAPEHRLGYMIPSAVIAEPMLDLAGRVVNQSPYRGLLPFREPDQRFFCGRDESAMRLAFLVERSPVVTVVGPSGCGKTSLLFAGVVPQLRRQSPGTVVVSTRPGAAGSPLDSLAAALLPELEPEAGEIERLARVSQLAVLLREGQLPIVVDRLLTTRGSDETRLVLIIDQFEELYANGDREVRDFVGAVLSSISHPGQVRIILSVRADFLDHLLEHGDLAEAMQEGRTFPVGRMGREQLRQAIERPLGDDVAFEPGLAERICDDIEEASGDLPLLQFALTLLWERKHRQTLTHEAYERIGKVSGALAGYAERVWQDQISESDRPLARRLFTQLVRHREDSGPTRRVVRRRHLDDEVWRLAQVLASARLVVTGRDADGSPTVELAHEALIDAWGRLRSWLDADKSFFAWRDRLQSMQASWERHNHDPDVLLRGSALAEADRWLEERDADVSSSTRTYVLASRDRQDRSVRRLRASRRVFQVLTAAVAVLLVITLVAATREREQARRLRAANATAVASALVQQARSRMTDQPDLAALFAVAAYQTDRTRPEALDFLNEQSLDYHDIAHLLPAGGGRVEAASASRDGHIVATLDDQEIVFLWGFDRQRWTRRTTPDLGRVRAIALSPDGSALAVGTQDDTIDLWRTTDWHPIRAGLRIPRPTRGKFDVARIFFSPDGRGLAAEGGSSPDLTIWNLPSGVLSARVPKGEDGTNFFGPNANILISNSSCVPCSTGDPGGGRGITIRDLKTGKRTIIARGVTSFAVSGNGQTIAIAGEDAPGGITVDKVEMWHTSPLRRGTTYHVSSATGFGLHPGSVAVNDSGTLLVIASTLRRLEIVDTLRGMRIKTLTTPPFDNGAGILPVLAFAGDDTVITAVRGDLAAMAVRLKYDDRGKPKQETTGATLTEATFSPDGPLAAAELICGGLNDCHYVISLWDPASGTRIPLDRTTTTTSISPPLAFSPDGHHLATGGGVAGGTIGRPDGTVLLWSVSHHVLRLVGRTKPPGTLNSTYRDTSSLAFSADGSLMAITNGVVTRWGGSRWQQLPRLKPYRQEPLRDDFSIGGRPSPVIPLSRFETLLTPTENPSSLEVREDTGKRVRAFTGGHRAQVVALAVSADQTNLASVDASGTIQVWNLATGEKLGDPLAEEHSADVHIKLVAAGRRLVYARPSNRGPEGSNSQEFVTIAVWDLNSHRRLIDADLPMDGAFPTIDTSADGQQIVISDGNLELLPVQQDPDTEQRNLCRTIGHGLTIDDWRAIGLEQWYQPTCQ